MEDLPERIIRALLRFAASWLAAGLVMITALLAGTEGHAHVPFSTFPGWLLLTPVAPVAAPVMLANEATRGRAAVALLVGATIFALTWRAFRRHEGGRA